MSSASDQTSQGVPAHPSFLAIYNPSLGPTDETRQDQIVFYSTTSLRAPCDRQRPSDPQHGAQEEQNEQLRQVGLAQGIVNFAKNFSQGKSVDNIETERSRIVLHELEQGWWILASIDFTRLPPISLADGTKTRDPDASEYSSREVSPPHLILQNLLRAHSIFLLHHGPTLDSLYSQMDRPRFCTLLHRFWTRFLRNWDVILHGNPAVDIFHGIKLAGGGELGVGVGEEEWGSGEREVLEDFIARTHGLVELVVSRFGDAPEDSDTITTGQKTATFSARRQVPWHAVERDPRPSDGVLFSSPGAISRRSLATISHWLTDIYKYGGNAYGVRENPTGRPRRKRRRLSPESPQAGKSTERPHDTKGSARLSPYHSAHAGESMNDYDNQGPGIPPSLIKAVEQSLQNASAKASSRDASLSPGKAPGGPLEDKPTAPVFDTDRMMKFLSLGYGSSWTFGHKAASEDESQSTRGRSQTRSKESVSKGQQAHLDASSEPELPGLEAIEPHPETSDHEDPPFVQRLQESIGRFLIGLSGDLENQDLDDDGTDSSSRISFRTLTVEMHQPFSTLQRENSTPSLCLEQKTSAPDSAEMQSESASSATRYQQLRVAVYVHQPFIFTFLFELHTPSLALSSFYRSIHHQLGPLQRPLLRSTDPATVAARIANAMGPGRTTSPISPTRTAPPPIYDLIYDPEKLTVHGSLPNIPRPQSLASADDLVSMRHQQKQTISGSWYTLGIPTSASSSSRPSSPLRTQTQTQNHPYQSSSRMDWTRPQALNVHTQILNTHAATRRPSTSPTGDHSSSNTELERLVKTSRGWWVLWLRVQGRVNANSTADSQADDSDINTGRAKEAILVRKARDDTASGGAAAARGRQVSSSMGMGMGMGMGWLVRDRAKERDLTGSSTASAVGTATTGVAAVSEGVGVDARMWVEGLLSLNR